MQREAAGGTTVGYGARTAVQAVLRHVPLGDYVFARNTSLRHVQRSVRRFDQLLPIATNCYQLFPIVTGADRRL